MNAKFFKIMLNSLKFGLLALILPIKVAGQCVMLEGYEIFFRGTKDERRFKMYPEYFVKATDCQEKAQYYSNKGNYDVNCKRCETDNLPQNASEASKPDTKANSGNGATVKNAPPKAATTGSPGNLCQSQADNIQKIKEAQNKLGKNEEATVSVLNSAMNQMKNLECGIVLKNVECRNNNCNFEWSTKESNILDAQAKASVDRFKKGVAAEEKEKVENNMIKAELVELGVAAASAIADAIDKNYQGKQHAATQPLLKPVDDNGDGKTDVLSEDIEGGGQRLYMDLDGDGIADKVANIDKYGRTTYENIEEGNRILMESSNPNEVTNVQKPRYDNLSEVNAIVKSRETIAEIARIYALDPDLSTKYSKEAELDNFKSGDYKCNKFVYDILKQSGLNPETPNGILGFSPTSANQWADPSFTVPGWRVLGKGEAILPGDVISMPSEFGADYSGHVGICVGEGKTASASSYANKLVINDWGFRSFDKNHRIVRRYDPN